jgi:flagellar biosynthesis protein FlhA
MRFSRVGTIAVPAAVVTVVVMLVVPMPTFVLDALISVNITFAVVVLLLSMHVSRPLDFSVFPTILLLGTLFRLALNVSATRLILSHGYAGTVINSFGHFIVGSSIVVGLVVFLILIIIQFVVINNGAGRVAEVAARFTLDAMPGKQMAIDADLNGGMIGADEAKRRRKEIADQADFYGAMDGASKFVKGDAVAALIIVFVNLIGGLIIGVAQRHLSVSSAVNTYSLLSIGDGLVSQIPALLMSISTGIVVTRTASDDSDFGTQLLEQVRNQHKAVQMAGGAIAIVGFFPGLPHIAFVLVGLGMFFLGRQAGRTAEKVVRKAEIVKASAPQGELTAETLAPEMRVDALELELAIDLIDLVDATHGGDLLERVRGLRRKIAKDLGIVIPPVRTRDNVALPNNTYAVRLHGVEVARGTAPPGRVLVMGAGADDLPGEPTTEPVFGLPARWVPLEFRHVAQTSGATVVDRASVITTHVGEVVSRNAGKLLSRQQLRALLDVMKRTEPVVVEELASANVPLSEVQNVLCDLLDDGVPIRDLARILEAITDRAQQSKAHEALLDAARTALGPAICARYADDKGRLPIFTFEAAFEQSLLDSLRSTDDGTLLGIPPSEIDRMAAEVTRMTLDAEKRGENPVLVCSARLRPALRRVFRSALPRLGILSVHELGPQVRPERIGVVSVAASTL